MFIVSVLTRAVEVEVLVDCSLILMMMMLSASQPFILDNEYRYGSSGLWIIPVNNSNFPAATAASRRRRRRRVLMLLSAHVIVGVVVVVGGGREGGREMGFASTLHRRRRVPWHVCC